MEGKGFLFEKQTFMCLLDTSQVVKPISRTYKMWSLSI